MAYVGDVVHILCYALLDKEEAEELTLKVVHVDEQNQITGQ